MKTIPHFLSAGIVAVFGCSLGHAQTIYSDTYASGGNVNINGTAPTVANSFAGGTSAATWNDVLGVNNTRTFFADGANSTTAGDSWLLPFTPQSGYVYTLTATLSFASNPGNWVGIGFAQHDPVNIANGQARFADSAVNGSDWMILSAANGNVQYFAGPAATTEIYNGTGFTLGPPVRSYTETEEVILDTTGSQWSIAGFVNGNQMGSTYTYASNPSIDSVGISQNALNMPSDVLWNSLVLAVAPVPEPSVLAMMGLGLVGVLRRNKIKS